MTKEQLEKINKLKYKGAIKAPFISALSKKKHISLIGFMGAGKSTISFALGKQAFDLDFLVEKKAMLKIYDIFKNFGETRFRELELAMLQEISKKTSPICLATGGGVITQEAARDELKKNYYNIFLYLPPEISCQRIENNKKRPLFSQNIDKMKELFDQRLDWYLEVADLVMDTEEISTEESISVTKNLLKTLQTKSC